MPGRDDDDSGLLIAAGHRPDGPWARPLHV